MTAPPSSPESKPLLRRVSPAEARRCSMLAPDDDALPAAREIIQSVRSGGLKALLQARARFDGRPDPDPLLLDRPALRRALDHFPAADRAALQRAADRIRTFAQAQRACLQDLSMLVGEAAIGHTVLPIPAAGCYAPGGRFPLPSSVLMTAIPARAAGCQRVIVATPSDHPAMLAAAALADADGLLLCGGAHAVAALALGVEGLDPVDIVAGPGNRYVTAAKRLLYGEVGVDLIAGPSELLVLADDSADPDFIAADLLAQAEHDADARPMLLTTDPSLPERVEARLAQRLQTLPTAPIARQALAVGFACIVNSDDEMAALASDLAAEHVQVLTRDPGSLAQRVLSAGAVFLGPHAAEVLGDYGLGPNHTLPTRRAARFSAGLSVFTFCRARTFVRASRSDSALLDDTARLARLEGLEAHARAAEARRPGPRV